jgi:UrcA family protein
MNAIKISLSAALAASVLTLAPSFAADLDAPREVAVYYQELKMNTDHGAAALYSRLRAASRQVCSAYDSRELRQRAVFKACFDHALTNAVATVNRTGVTALHMKAAKGVKAS